MLKGSREGVLQRMQPISIHGQLSYDVHYTFADEPDGQALHLAVNGQWSEPGALTGRAVPANRDLIIGQYERREPAYAFQGTIRGLKLYSGAMMR